MLVGCTSETERESDLGSPVAEMCLSVCFKLNRHQNSEQWFVLLRQDYTSLEKLSQQQLFDDEDVTENTGNKVSCYSGDRPTFILYSGLHYFIYPCAVPVLRH